jgi:shikimate dehydrogenase
VNCTASGLDRREPTFKELPLAADLVAEYQCVVDLVYSETETAIIEAARERSVAFVDGLELLVRQGALSFELFTGRPPPIDTMRAAVRSG